jgi:hypothetical protein
VGWREEEEVRKEGDDSQRAVESLLFAVLEHG